MLLNCCCNIYSGSTTFRPATLRPATVNTGHLIPRHFIMILNIHSFIHSFKDLYSTSSRKLLRGAPDSSTVKKNIGTSRSYSISCGGSAFYCSHSHDNNDNNLGPNPILVCLKNMNTSIYI